MTFLASKITLKLKPLQQNFILYLINNISKFITIEVTQILICTLIFPHLDYAYCILVISPKTTIKPLQQVQNSAARLVFQRAKFYSMYYTDYWSPKGVYTNFGTQFVNLYMVKDHITYIINSKLRPSLGQSERQMMPP